MPGKSGNSDDFPKLFTILKGDVKKVGKHHPLDGFQQFPAWSGFLHDLAKQLLLTAACQCPTRLAVIHTPRSCPRFPPSSTPRPTKPPRSPPTPCCRSSRPSPSTPASPWKPATSRSPAASSPSSRTSSPTTSRSPDALAELGALTLKPEANIIKLPNISASVPAAQGRHRRAPGQRLRAPRSSRKPADRRRKGHQGPLRQSHGQRREPRPPRRQLRPPRAQGRQGLRQEAPALDGRLVRRFQDHRRHHGGKDDFFSNEKSVMRPRRHRCENRVHRRGRHHQGPQGNHPAQGR